MAIKNNNELPEIVIRSESDAYEILEKASRGEIEPFSSFRFDGWPTLNLYMKGEKFEQSITPTVMKGLIELQKSLYRSYASAKFDEPNKRLSEDEKDALEIKVSVKGGSSNFEINYQELAVKFVEQIGAKMNPTEVLYAVVSIAVLYFGTSAYRSFLENRKEIRVKETSDETQRQTLEAMKFTSEQETKRTQIITDLVKEDHRIENIVKQAYEAHTEIVKSLSAGTMTKIDDITLSPSITEALSQNARRKSNDVRLDGNYRLLKLDWSDPTRFKVKVWNIDTGLQLDADVQDDSLTGKYKDALKAAEWSRRPVKLQINAKQIGDDSYRDATVVSAELIKNESDA